MQFNQSLFVVQIVSPRAEEAERFSYDVLNLVQFVGRLHRGWKKELNVVFYHLQTYKRKSGAQWSCRIMEFKTSKVLIYQQLILCWDPFSCMDIIKFTVSYLFVLQISFIQSVCLFALCKADWEGVGRGLQLM